MAGWTAGIGVEHKFARHWSLFAEYNHMDFGTNPVKYNSAPAGVPGGPFTAGFNIKQSADTALVGLNYRF